MNQLAIGATIVAAVAVLAGTVLVVAGVRLRRTTQLVRAAEGPAWMVRF